MNESAIYSQDEIEQLIQLTEELQTENEQLRKKTTQQEQTLQSLTERIEKLSRSDLELKEAKEKKQSAEQLLKQSLKEKQSAEASARESADRERRAEQTLHEAREKGKRAESYIQERVKQESDRIASQNAQELARATKRARVENSITTYALTLYGVILTVFWAIAQWNVIKTIPEWFVRRYEDISNLFKLLGDGFTGIHDLLPSEWPDPVRYLIPILIYGACAVGLYFLIRAIVRRFKGWNARVWDKYTQEDEKRLKKSIHGIICAVSLFVAVTISGLFPNGVNVLSWFFLFSIFGNLIYHAEGNKKRDYY